MMNLNSKLENSKIPSKKKAVQSNLNSWFGPKAIHSPPKLSLNVDSTRSSTTSSAPEGLESLVIEDPTLSVLSQSVETCVVGDVTDKNEVDPPTQDPKIVAENSDGLGPEQEVSIQKTPVNVVNATTKSIQNSDQPSKRKKNSPKTTGKKFRDLVKKTPNATLKSTNVMTELMSPKFKFQYDYQDYLGAERMAKLEQFCKEYDSKENKFPSISLSEMQDGSLNLYLSTMSVKAQASTATMGAQTEQMVRDGSASSASLSGTLQRHLSRFGQYLFLARWLNDDVKLSMNLLWDMELIASFATLCMMLFREHKITGKTAMNNLIHMTKIVKMYVPQAILAKVDPSAIEFAKSAFSGTAVTLYAQVKFNCHLVDGGLRDSLGKNLKLEEVQLLCEASIHFVNQMEIWRKYNPSQITIPLLLLFQASIIIFAQIVTGGLRIQMLRDIVESNIWWDETNDTYVIQAMWSKEDDANMSTRAVPRAAGIAILAWKEHYRPILEKKIMELGKQKELPKNEMIWMDATGKIWLAGVINTWLKKWMNMVLPQSVLTSYDIRRGILNLFLHHRIAIEGRHNSKEFLRLLVKNANTSLEMLYTRYATTADLEPTLAVEEALEQGLNTSAPDSFLEMEKGLPIPKRKVAGFPRSPLSPWFDTYCPTSMEWCYRIGMRQIQNWHYVPDIKSKMEDPLTKEIITQSTQHRAGAVFNHVSDGKLRNQYGEKGFLPIDCELRTLSNWSRQCCIPLNATTAELEAYCWKMRTREIILLQKRALNQRKKSAAKDDLESNENEKEEIAKPDSDLDGQEQDVGESRDEEVEDDEEADQAYRELDEILEILETLDED